MKVIVEFQNQYHQPIPRKSRTVDLMAGERISVPSGAIWVQVREAKEEPEAANG